MRRTMKTKITPETVEDLISETGKWWRNKSLPLLNESLRQLSDEEFDVIHFVYFEKRETAYVAAILDINENMVKELLKSAYEQLQARLTKASNTRYTNEDVKQLLTMAGESWRWETKFAKEEQPLSEVAEQTVKPITSSENRIRYRLAAQDEKPKSWESPYPMVVHLDDSDEITLEVIFSRDSHMNSKIHLKTESPKYYGQEIVVSLSNDKQDKLWERGLALHKLSGSVIWKGNFLLGKLNPEPGLTPKAFSKKSDSPERR